MSSRFVFFTTKRTIKKGRSINENSKFNNDENVSDSDGIIELFDEVCVQDILQIENNIKYTRTNQPKKLSNNYNSALLCLALVPSYMIPVELLHFFSANLKNIKSLRILRHYSQPDKYLAVLQTDSVESASTILKDYNNELMCSLENTHCLLFPIKQITFEEEKYKEKYKDQTVIKENDEYHYSISTVSNSFNNEKLQKTETETETEKTEKLEKSKFGEEVEEQCPVCLEGEIIYFQKVFVLFFQLKNF
jgi:hypothetical protein